MPAAPWILFWRWAALLDTGLVALLPVAFCVAVDLRNQWQSRTAMSVGTRVLTYVCSEQRDLQLLHRCPRILINLTVVKGLLHTHGRMHEAHQKWGDACA